MGGRQRRTGDGRIESAEVCRIDIDTGRDQLGEDAGGCGSTGHDFKENTIADNQNKE